MKGGRPLCVKPNVEKYGRRHACGAPWFHTWLRPSPAQVGCGPGGRPQTKLANADRDLVMIIPNPSSSYETEGSTTATPTTPMSGVAALYGGRGFAAGTLMKTVAQSAGAAEERHSGPATGKTQQPDSVWSGAQPGRNFSFREQCIDEFLKSSRFWKASWQAVGISSLLGHVHPRGAG